MSEINYQALREAAEAIKVVATPQKLLAFRMKVTPQVVLALLDEIKRLEDTNIDAMCRIAELETNLAALSAENELARKAVQAFCDVVGDSTEVICEEIGRDGVLVILEAMKATGNMPATDAFLSELRAQGVEMMREHPSIKLCSLTHICDELATQIRKGVQS
ncbi:TPA: ead/Ea22-like family protein [Escherichia coli]|nr:ead/Ea22-like family protein [Escherichia coli]HDW8492000.1 ead/Ea22-like family protein [Escherichia coli]HDW8501890.1 ead/Ea22-like family protein [Escherichia coli]HDW8519263.1 ead/Ea22-like family protein [Escherichia coli]HDW8529221.1 ead/Ea22-like family protein [Escherichia coli]